MTTELHQIEVTIEQAKDTLEAMRALERLRKNKDFIKLIEEGYLKDEACRLVLARAEPALQTTENQSQLNKMIDGVGYFRQYLNKIYQMGHHAEASIEDHENTRAELLREVN